MKRRYMKQQWTLRFKKLGLIEEGAVRIAPLMIFTGDNNTGKSYVMTLLWGVIALGRGLFPTAIPESESYRQCEKWLGSFLQEGEDEKTLLPEDEEVFVRWFGDVLNQRRKTLCDELFGENAVRLRELRIADFVRERPLSLRWNRDAAEGSRYSSGKHYVRFPLPSSPPPRAEVYRMIQYLTWKLIMDDLSAPLYPPRSPVKTVPSGEILYLPAARTGFIILRKIVASAALSSEAKGVQLLLPVRYFLQRLLTLSFKEKNRFSAFADILERRILRGHIHPDGAPLPEYRYSPQGQDNEALPLWRTSSLVTELAPLLVFLRGDDDFRSLIIEEPEAHLHLEMQRELARLLVRLVNSGLPVWITTHGDSFFQQVSNLVKASAMDDAALSRLDLEPEENIQPERVSAWHFQRVSASSGRDRTEISPLHTDHDGIAATAFNAAIAELTRQTLDLSPDDEA